VDLVLVTIRVTLLLQRNWARQWRRAVSAWSMVAVEWD